MAELDYAFLADYAVVEAGKLSAMGASFTEVVVPAFPTGLRLHVAGRVRAQTSEDDIELLVSVTSPDGTFQLEGALALETEGAVPYRDDLIGLLFAVGMELPLQGPGLCEVVLSLDGEQARILRFDVVGPA